MFAQNSTISQISKKHMTQIDLFFCHSICFSAPSNIFQIYVDIDQSILKLLFILTFLNAQVLVNSQNGFVLKIFQSPPTSKKSSSTDPQPRTNLSFLKIQFIETSQDSKFKRLINKIKSSTRIIILMVQKYNCC